MCALLAYRFVSSLVCPVQATVKAFQKRADCLINQYSKYSVTGPDGKEVFVNGNLTSGESAFSLIPVPSLSPSSRPIRPLTLLSFLNLPLRHR